MYGIFLASLPLSARVCCTLFLLGIGLGALAASIQASTAVGLSYGDVVASFAPEMPLTHIGHGQMSAERPIELSQLPHTAQSWIRTPLLIQTSHTHLFGQTLIAGLLGLLFLFSSLGEGKKAVIVALPFIGKPSEYAVNRQRRQERADAAGTQGATAEKLAEIHAAASGGFARHG